MKRWLVLGGSGTLGRAISAEIRQRGDSVVTAARRGADLPVDIRQANWLSGALEAVKPDGTCGTTIDGCRMGGRAFASGACQARSRGSAEQRAAPCRPR